MTCADILDIKELSEIWLAAGKDGLNRPVRWIYFADSLAVENRADEIENWIAYSGANRKQQCGKTAQFDTFYRI